MAVSSAPIMTAVNEPRPASTSAELVPPKRVPGKNAAVAAPSAAAGGSKPGTKGRVPVRRIGEILVDLGYVTPAQVDQALEDKEDTYARLGVRLLRRGVISERQLARAVSLSLGGDFTELTDPSEIQPAAIAVVPARIARRCSLIPAAAAGSGQNLAENFPRLYGLLAANSSFFESLLAVKWVLLTILGMLALGFTLLYRKGDPLQNAGNAALPDAESETATKASKHARGRG